ncbi:MAG: F0F1 ATP synthase subunit A [Planctomycetota bacterium]
MNDMPISTDEIVLWQFGWLKLNATILYTWVAMAVLIVTSIWLRRELSSKTRISKMQCIAEIIMDSIRQQIGNVSGKDPIRFVPFIATMFLLIATASLLGVVPGYIPPTASFSTTLALAFCVFIAVPIFGIQDRGVGPYLAQYLKPTWLMLPFNLVAELSRTFALAVRLYGNMMSGAVIGAVLLLITPLFIPVLMQILGLITGMIQAYIFSILAMVYIASALSERPNPSFANQTDVSVNERVDKVSTSESAAAKGN